ncbi:leucine--tRNA ligase [Aurantibacillus circumpalustris]|uniref:leucine--tRNA ligase n=1 Tax=Aurantibacillus circumpalustris TaxID=3036359 RepID=UPI00295B9450|nr:class I tRNA ligase family protein [Aurantibacillus circumpalustris]
MDYNFTEIEKRWQDFWAKNKTFKAEDTSDKPKYYVLDMFPYPSGAGLHVGHPLGYIASDIMARYKRHKGFNVLHPMGYDSFGLPAEQYAIQTGQHPKITTEQNIARYHEQMDKIGFSFDWDREVRTSDPEYYKWTQWIFIQLFNSWYNKNTDKAEKLESLISEFEKNGNAAVNAVCDEDVKSFTSTEWKAFNEKEQSDLLMQYRIAYLGEAYVNWCAALGTVLANDEVKDGVSERGGHPVERKLMKQWNMRITAYAQRLLDGLEKIDWPESLKESQRYWIGKSEGTSLKFKVQSSKVEIEVFTTRPDTIFGVSFVTLAPEHELVAKLTTTEQKSEIEEYVAKTKMRSERERQADVTKVSGAFTGAYVEHPFSGKQIPIWIGDYVLAGYGTGAVMAVPGHDSRDYAFAKHFNLPILEVVSGGDLSKESYDAKEGKLVNSDFLNGLEVKKALKKAIAEIENKKLGKGKTNYRLRDAVFGRQRYWGEPIPIYYKDGIPHALADNELPLILPEVDKYLPTEDGEPPLARAATSWKKDGKYDYENTTMPGWAGSSWYFLRYMDSKNSKQFVSGQLADYWQNVDLYIGGSEHATGHLLYVRFWTKFLNDLGLIGVDEPAKKLINQGMIQGRSNFVYRVLWAFSGKPFDTMKLPQIIISKDCRDKVIHGDPDETSKLINYCNETLNQIFTDQEVQISSCPEITEIHIDVNIVENDEIEIDTLKEWRSDFKESYFLTEEGITKLKCGSLVEKMSKRWYNVVTPDSICEKFGSDTLRLYEMFLGPLEQSKPWNTNGITGVSGFLKKLWKLFYQNNTLTISEAEPSKAELKTLHKTIKKITEDIERFSFNTSVSNFMICVNELTEQKCNKRAILEPLLVLVSPYAPHIAEELWSQLGHKESIAFAKFPECNETFLVEDSFTYPVSFNGKMRFSIELPATLTIPEIEKEVMSREEVQKYLEGKTPKKIIIVPKKIVNFVV